MTRWLGVVLVLACLLTPVTLAVREQRHVRNFHVVREGVLYRSAQLTVPGLRRLVHDYGIRTVVNLRDGSTVADCAEEEFCTRADIRFVRLLPRAWDGGPGRAAVDGNVRTFLSLVRDPANHPILVHCFAGIHRTGAFCALYRMECQGWSNARAAAELKALGYDNYDNEADIRGYIEHYRVNCLDRRK